jgi:hypothetical protein
MTYHIPDALDAAVFHHTRSDCRRVDDSLGIQKMPFGYALMLDADEMYFYWLRYDGLESSQHWNKWAIFRGAKMNHANALAVVQTAGQIVAVTTS